MTKDPVCCLPNDMVVKAAKLMKSENIGSIPVIENERTKKLVGIVTDRDITLKTVAENLDAKSTQVEAVMTRQVVTCNAEDDVQRALDVMAEISCDGFPSWITMTRSLGSLLKPMWQRGLINRQKLLKW
jgi:CBS domain-containing protein